MTPLFDIQVIKTMPWGDASYAVTRDGEIIVEFDGSADASESRLMLQQARAFKKTHAAMAEQRARRESDWATNGPTYTPRLYVSETYLGSKRWQVLVRLGPSQGDGRSLDHPRQEGGFPPKRKLFGAHRTALEAAKVFAAELQADGALPRSLSTFTHLQANHQVVWPDTWEGA